MLDMARLDHLALTVADVKAACDFYVRVLGMSVETFGEGRTALRFGAAQKIDLYPAGDQASPRAARPTPGSADLCFIAGHPLAEFMDHLAALGVTPEAGPAERVGATGAIRSVFLRDPDQNLIEVAEYIL